MTRQRLSVLEALSHSGQALSPPDLLAIAKSAVPTLNLSTVYRQLKALQDRGQIVRVELPGQPARFEIAVADDSASASPHRHDEHAAALAERGVEHAHRHEHHHHFHCIECDRVYPIHACPGPMNDLAPPGFEVQHHDLTLRGRCASCVAGASA